MNTNRRHLLHLAALSTTALALPGRALATVTERSGSPDRKVTHTTFWRNTLSCDNAGVPVSQRNGRMASPADFGGAQQCTMLKDSVEGPFFFCTNPGAAEIARREGVPAGTVKARLSRGRNLLREELDRHHGVVRVAYILVRSTGFDGEVCSHRSSRVPAPAECAECPDSQALCQE